MTDPAAISLSLSAQHDALQAAKARSPATMAGQGFRESIRNAELVKERNSEKNRAEYFLKQVNELKSQIESMKIQQAEEKAKSREPVSQSNEARAEVARLTNLLAEETQRADDEKERADGAEMSYAMEEGLHKETQDNADALVQRYNNEVANLRQQLTEANDSCDNLVIQLNKVTDEWREKCETVNMDLETSQRNLQQANVELYNARQSCQTLASEKLNMEQDFASKRASLLQEFASKKQTMQKSFDSELAAGVKKQVAEKEEKLKQWKLVREAELKESKSKNEAELEEHKSNFETDLKSEYDAELKEHKSNFETDLKSEYDAEFKEHKSKFETDLKSKYDAELEKYKSKFETDLKSKYEAELEEHKSNFETDLKSKCEADLKSKYEAKLEGLKSTIERTCESGSSERLAKANTDKESAERQLGLKDEEIRNLNTDKENAKRQLALKDEAIRNLNKKLTKQSAASNSMQEELAKEIAGLKGALQTAIAEKSSIATLTASASRAPAAVDPLKAQTVDQLLFTIEKLETQVKTATRDKQFIKGLHEYDMECLKFEKRQSRQLRITVASLEKRNSYFLSANRAMTDELCEVRENHDILKNEARKQKVLVDGLQHELADTKADLDRINSSLSDSVRDHATLQADFSRVQEEKNELETKLASVTKQLWKHRVLLKGARQARAFTGEPVVIEQESPPPASIPRASVRPRDGDNLSLNERLRKMLGDDSPPPPRSVVPAPSVVLPVFVPVATQTDELPAAPPKVPDSHTTSTQTESLDAVKEGVVPVDLGSTSPRWLARFRSIDLRFLYAVVFLFSTYACFVLGVGYDSWYRGLTENIPKGYELRYPAFMGAVSPLQVRLSAKWLDREWHRCLNWFFEDVLG
jgi:hypothetical protein